MTEYFDKKTESMSYQGIGIFHSVWSLIACAQYAIPGNETLSASSFVCTSTI